MYQVLVTVEKIFDFETDDIDNLIDMRDTISEILWDNISVDIINKETGKVILDFLL